MHLFALPKRQIFPYVLPSEPQTGASMFLQPIPGDTQEWGFTEKHEAILSWYCLSYYNIAMQNHYVRHMSKSLMKVLPPTHLRVFAPLRLTHLSLGQQRLYHGLTWHLCPFLAQRSLPNKALPNNYNRRKNLGIIIFWWRISFDSDTKYIYIGLFHRKLVSIIVDQLWLPCVHIFPLDILVEIIDANF